MMSQWVEQLDAFFRFNQRPVLDHKGKVSRQDMETKVREELRKYREQSQTSLLDPPASHGEKS